MKKKRIKTDKAESLKNSGEINWQVILSIKVLHFSNHHPVCFVWQAELQRDLQACESKAAAAQDALSEKETELRELKSQKAAEQGLISKEEHEALRLSLQAEINASTARFNDLTRKHEKTCTEVGVFMRMCVVLSAISLLQCNLKLNWMLLFLWQSELRCMRASVLPLHYLYTGTVLLSLFITSLSSATVEETQQRCMKGTT